MPDCPLPRGARPEGLHERQETKEMTDPADVAAKLEEWSKHHEFFSPDEEPLLELGAKALRNMDAAIKQARSDALTTAVRIMREMLIDGNDKWPDQIEECAAAIEKLAD